MYHINSHIISCIFSQRCLNIISSFLILHNINNHLMQAIKRFIQGLNESYTRYLEPSRMIDHRKRISGVRAVGVGLRISRQLCLSPTYLRYVYGYARRTILLSYRWNVFYTIASSAITLFYKASNISSSSDAICTSSRVIDTNEPFNYKHDDQPIDQDHRPHGSNGLRQLMGGRLRQLAVRLLSLLLLLHSPIHNPTSTSPVAGQQPSSHQHAHRCNHTLLRDRGYHDLHLSKPQLWSSMSFQSMLLLLRNSIIISCIVAAAVMIVAECCSTVLWTQYSSMHHLHHSPHLLTTIQHWTRHHHNHYHRLMGFSSTSSSLSSLFLLLIALPLFDFLFRLYPYICPIVIQDDDIALGVVPSTPRGLRSNDRIIAIDDEMVLGRYHSIYEITRMLDDGAVGDVVHVSILRIDRKNEDHHDMDSDSSNRGNKNNDNNVVNYHHYLNYQHPQRSDDMGDSCNRLYYQSFLPSLSSLSTHLTLLRHRHRHRHAVTERSYALTREYLSSISPLIQRVMPSRQGSYLGETHVYMILS